MVEVSLGFEHELVGEETDYSCTKLGGTPNWPLQDIGFDSKCPLCNLHRPLILQCYAPLQNSAFHRTLYIFACINPVCWNKNESWSCVRSQLYDKSYDQSVPVPSKTNTESKDSWCSGADDWGNDDIEMKTAFGGGAEAQNSKSLSKKESKMSDDDNDDDDLEATGIVDVENAMQNINFNTKKAISKEACAEIEGGESEVVVDTPSIPQNDITELFLKLPELPQRLKEDNAKIEFVTKYVYIDSEYLPTDEKNINDSHIKQLLQNYERENKNDVKILERTKKITGMLKCVDNSEEYEKDAPLHGNELFHNFLTRIQYNPGQIIRYSLGGQPLIMNRIPAGFNSKLCKNCNGPIQFELQLLSTLIPSLRIPGSSETHLEFGTILIYTCKSSCWKDFDKTVEEYCLVQAEPL